MTLVTIAVILFLAAHDTLGGHTEDLCANKECHRGQVCVVKKENCHSQNSICIQKAWCVDKESTATTTQTPSTTSHHEYVDDPCDTRKCAFWEECRIQKIEVRQRPVMCMPPLPPWARRNIPPPPPPFRPRGRGRRPWRGKASRRGKRGARGRKWWRLGSRRRSSRCEMEIVEKLGAVCIAKYQSQKFADSCGGSGMSIVERKLWRHRWNSILCFEDNDCPKGAYCHTNAGEHPFCCLRKLEIVKTTPKPELPTLTCPKPFVTKVQKVYCRENCTSDDSCEGEYKCCSDGCFKKCIVPDRVDTDPCSRLNCQRGKECRVLRICEDGDYECHFKAACLARYEVRSDSHLNHCPKESALVEKFSPRRFDRHSQRTWAWQEVTCYQTRPCPSGYYCDGIPMLGISYCCKNPQPILHLPTMEVRPSFGYFKNMKCDEGSHPRVAKMWNFEKNQFDLTPVCLESSKSSLIGQHLLCKPGDIIIERQNFSWKEVGCSHRSSCIKGSVCRNVFDSPQHPYIADYPSFCCLDESAKYLHPPGVFPYVP